MRATTRRLTGLKISMVFVAGRLITTFPAAMATSLKPGSPGKSTMATCRSLAANIVAIQLRIRRKRIGLALCIRGDLPLRVVGCGLRPFCCLGANQQIAIGNWQLAPAKACLQHALGSAASGDLIVQTVLLIANEGPDPAWRL